MNSVSVIRSYEDPEVVAIATIESWLATIRNDANPNKDLVLQTRADIENKNVYKAQMVCIAPHGTFHDRGAAKNLIEVSGYVLIDLDVTHNPDVVSFKDSFADIEIVRAAWVSASGRGLALLVPVEGMTRENFNPTVRALHKYFEERGIIPDPMLKSIASKNCLSFDPEIIIKKTWLPYQAVEGIVCSVNDREEKEHNSPNDTFLRNEHPLETAMRLAGEYAVTKSGGLRFKTNENFTDGASFHTYLDGREWDRIYIPPVIPEGKRYTTMRGIALTIAKLNPNVSKEMFSAFMASINKKFCKPILPATELHGIIDWVWQLKVNNRIEISSGRKYVVFNDQSGLSLKEKLQISGREIGRIRRDRTKKLLQEAFTELEQSHGRKPTQAELQSKSGKSIATIKRYWMDIH